MSDNWTNKDLACLLTLRDNRNQFSRLHVTSRELPAPQLKSTLGLNPERLEGIDTFRAESEREEFYGGRKGVDRSLWIYLWPISMSCGLAKVRNSFFSIQESFLWDKSCFMAFLLTSFGKCRWQAGEVAEHGLVCLGMLSVMNWSCPFTASLHFGRSNNGKAQNFALLLQ